MDPSVQLSRSILSQSQDVQTHVVLRPPSQAEAKAPGAPLQLHGETTLHNVRRTRSREAPTHTNIHIMLTHKHRYTRFPDSLEARSLYARYETVCVSNNLTLQMVARTTLSGRSKRIICTWLGPVTHNVPCSLSGRVLWSDQFPPSLFSSTSRL